MVPGEVTLFKGAVTELIKQHSKNAKGKDIENYLKKTHTYSVNMYKYKATININVVKHIINSH